LLAAFAAQRLALRDTAGRSRTRAGACLAAALRLVAALSPRRLAATRTLRRRAGDALPARELRASRRRPRGLVVVFLGEPPGSADPAPLRRRGARSSLRGALA